MSVEVVTEVERDLIGRPEEEASITSSGPHIFRGEALFLTRGQFSRAVPSKCNSFLEFVPNLQWE